MTTDTQPRLLLTCTVCGWRPYDDQTMDDVQAHYETEHESAPLAMTLRAYCPRDDVPLEVRMTGTQPRTGKNITTYDCPSCHRTYRVKWDPTNPVPE